MVLGGALGLIWSPVTHATALCVAGVAQTHIYHRFAWQAWHKLTSAALCVAGVAQTHIYHCFAWQAWHWWQWVARLVWFGRPWRRGTLRGSRGTNWHLPSFCVACVAQSNIACDAAALCVAGVVQTHIYHRFAWQAWHKLTSAALCVAGVAQAHIYRRFAWQSWHKLTSTIVLRGRHGTDGSAGKCCLYDVRQGIG